jgi:hypothetical protein
MKRQAKDDVMFGDGRRAASSRARTAGVYAASLVDNGRRLPASGFQLQRSDAEPIRLFISHNQ